MNSKWSVDPNVKCKTVKLLKDNIGGNLDDFGFDDNFLDVTPKAWSIKEIIDICASLKLKISPLLKTLSRQWEEKSQTRGKYLQKTQLKKGCYLKYTKYS